MPHLRITSSSGWPFFSKPFYGTPVIILVSWCLLSRDFINDHFLETTFMEHQSLMITRHYPVSVLSSSKNVFWCTNHGRDSVDQAVELIISRGLYWRIFCSKNLFLHASTEYKIFFHEQLVTCEMISFKRRLLTHSILYIWQSNPSWGAYLVLNSLGYDWSTIEYSNFCSQKWSQIIKSLFCIIWV